MANDWYTDTLVSDGIFMKNDPTYSTKMRSKPNAIRSRGLRCALKPYLYPKVLELPVIGWLLNEGIQRQNMIDYDKFRMSLKGLEQQYEEASGPTLPYKRKEDRYGCAIATTVCEGFLCLGLADVPNRPATAKWPPTRN